MAKNTPDILTEYLQFGGRAAFAFRLILAEHAHLHYGIYGIPCELCAHQAREHGSEEYLNSEKYEIRQWKFNSPDNLTEMITRINQVCREYPALQCNSSPVP